MVTVVKVKINMKKHLKKIMKDHDKLFKELAKN